MYCSMTSEQARASVNWDDIKLETLTRVQELVHLRPNLDRLLKNRLPRHKPTPQDVIPLGLPSSHKIKQSGVKYSDCEDPCCTQNGQQNLIQERIHTGQGQMDSLMNN